MRHLWKSCTLCAALGFGLAGQAAPAQQPGSTSQGGQQGTVGQGGTAGRESRGRQDAASGAMAGRHRVRGVVAGVGGGQPGHGGHAEPSNPSGTQTDSSSTAQGRTITIVGYAAPEGMGTGLGGGSRTGTTGSDATSARPSTSTRSNTGAANSATTGTGASTGGQATIDRPAATQATSGVGTNEASSGTGAQQGIGAESARRGLGTTPSGTSMAADGRLHVYLLTAGASRSGTTDPAVSQTGGESKGGAAGSTSGRASRDQAASGTQSISSLSIGDWVEVEYRDIAGSGAAQGQAESGKVTRGQIVSIRKVDQGMGSGSTGGGASGSGGPPRE